MDLYNYHRLLQTRNDLLQVIAPLYNKLHSSPVLLAIWGWIVKMNLYNYHRLLQTRNDLLQVIAPLYNKLHRSPVYSWQFRDEFGIWIYTTTTDYYRQETMCYKWTAKKGFKAVIIPSSLRKSTWLCYSVNPHWRACILYTKKRDFQGLTWNRIVLMNVFNFHVLMDKCYI